MKKFMAVYLAPQAEVAKMMASMSEEDGKKAMEDWGKWIDAHKANIIDAGAAMGKTKKVTREGVTDVKNDITGYSIVQAESHDEAAKMFIDHPHSSMIAGATIDVMEWIDMTS
jgi:hypothetical protein